MKSLTKTALLLSLLSFGAQAATITVNETTPGSGIGKIEPSIDNLCSIKEAFDNANNDAATHIDCVAGSGTDTIVLPPDAIFSITNAALVNDYYLGSLALPKISSAIHILGNGSTIERAHIGCNINGDRTSDEFRLLATRDDAGGSSAFLQTDRLTLRNGCADGSNDSEHSGGAVQVYGTGGAVFRNTVIENNSAFRGGGVRGSDLVFEGSLIRNNYAQYQGPGVSTQYNFTAVNTTFSGNTGAGFGSAIFFGWQTTARLDHVTFSPGGRAYHVTINGPSPKVAVHNSLFANSCFQGSSIGSILVTSSSGNVEEGTYCAAELGGGVVSNANLDLQGLADNGGSTPTQALGPNSDAIDSSACLTDAGSAVDIDQRGVSRPQDGDFNGSALCDAGAFEVLSPDFIHADGFEG